MFRILRRHFSIAPPSSLHTAGGKRFQSTKLIADIGPEDVGKSVRVRGWITAKRSMKSTIFLDINDGSGTQNLQVLAAKDAHRAQPLGYGVSVNARGVVSQAPSGQLELKTEAIEVLGECPLQRNGFPFVPKQVHPPEYIREHLHLRARVPSSSATFRVRHHASTAITDHLNRANFWQIHTPVLTTNDCEGGGEVFMVKPESAELLKSMARANVGPDQAYFDKTAYLSVSGQLHLEAMCHGLGYVYSFGPIFRAENSKTPIHLSEFYMLEAEQPFVTGISDITSTIESLLKNVTQTVLDRCPADLAEATRHAKHSPDYSWLDHPFATITYSEALAILLNHSSSVKCSAHQTDGLSKEQELFLVQHIGRPVFVVEWPRTMKPFYARPFSGSDSELVDAVDLLVPYVGELVGGSLRDDDYERLKAKLPVGGGNMDWYLDLRRFGGITTGGFGLGFERYLQWLLGSPNIKDVIPFPRWAHNCVM